MARFHARGGRSEVHVARDEELGRDVAVKFIRPQFASDTISRDRFQREAEITSCLDHPGVVPVYGKGRDDRGNLFYCMRFVEGKTLREAIDAFHGDDALKRDAGQRQIAFRKLLGHFIDACQTIAYAHSRGIVHRDIKPENIVLGAYGETQVIDWGLAKKSPASSPAEEEQTETVEYLPLAETGHTGVGSYESLTQYGMVLGTPAYMSPEQASGAGKIGEASDICNLGATFYSLLVGRSPFHGTTAFDTIHHAERSQFVLPRQVDRRISTALDAICQKAMAPDPSERYASASDLADDVERYLADEPVGAYTEPLHERIGRWSRRYKALVLSQANPGWIILIDA